MKKLDTSDTVAFNLRVPTDDWAFLRRYAFDRHQSINYTVTQLIMKLRRQHDNNVDKK